MNLASLLICLGVLTGAAYADEAPGTPSSLPPGFKVIVYGNHAFDDQAIIRMSGIDQDPDLSADQVKRRLETTSVFSNVQVKREEHSITIILEEKLTWFALPYFSSDEYSQIYGAAAGKAGLFGQDANFLGRYQYGKDDREGSVLIRDEFFMHSLWILGGSFDYEDSRHKFFHDRTVTQRLRNRYYGGSFQTGYHLKQNVIIGFNTYMETHRYQRPGGGESVGGQLSHRINLEIGTLNVNEGLTQGAKIRPYFETTSPPSGFQFRKYGVYAQAGVFLIGNFNWIMTPKFEAGAALPQYQQFEIGGAGSLRSFPNQEFRDTKYFSVSNDFLLTTIDIWKLKLRPLIYGDWAFVQNSGRTGVGSGFNVYFREVAVPALQFFAGWGFNPYGFTVAGSIGPRF